MTNLEWLHTLSAEEIAPILVGRKTLEDHDPDYEESFEYDVYFVPCTNPEDGILYGSYEEALDAATQWLISDDPFSREFLSRFLEQS